MYETSKRKLFISYYHDEDENYRDEFERLFRHLFINKSVKKGDINTEVSTEYIKRLLHEDYLKDASVLVVLIGANTWKRRYVDWEIYATLTDKVGGHSGLIGFHLPSHLDYQREKYNPDLIPPRLYDNIKSDYALLYDWTNDTTTMKARIEAAFTRKEDKADLINNSREQYRYNKQ